MKLWIDADACPKVIKEIVFRAIMRTKIPATLVANQPLSIPRSEYIKTVQVPPGFDIADNYIVEHVAPKDLVITADIPLADKVVDKGANALNPRGEFYTINNIKQQLSIRDHNAELRSSGIIKGGPATLSKQDIQKFSNSLDKFLSSR